ncbi:hypothetical protein VPH35_104606 [Triticum aestivum]
MGPLVCRAAVQCASCARVRVTKWGELRQLLVGWFLTRKAIGWPSWVGIGASHGLCWSCSHITSSLFVSLVNCIICGRIKLNYAPLLVFGDKILAVFTLPDCLLVICSFVTLSIVFFLR